MLKNNTYRRSLQEKRALEARRAKEDITKSIQRNNLLTATIASDFRAENKRRLRQLDVTKKDEETFESLIQDERRRQKVEEDLRKEEQIVLEMQELHNEQVREQKMRQYIHENSAELRELEKKLTYAYTNKERALQLEEKRLAEQVDKLQQNLVIQEMKRQAELLEQEEKENEKKKLEKAAQYNSALNIQLQELEEKKHQEYQQFLKEKALVDEVVRKIAEENEREAKARFEKHLETKKYIIDFMKERQQWKKEEQDRQDEENRKIEGYAKLQREREENIQMEKKKIEEGKNAIYDMAKMELEELRIDLAHEEQEELARRKEQELLRLRVQKRLELIDAYQKQVEYKAQMQKKEQEEEQIYRENLMKKFAEDDRLEQLSQQKRRMKQIEHKRAVDNLVEQRRKMNIEKKEEEQKEFEREKDLERYKQAVIENERQRLLREHAVKLVGFLPKGVLRDKKDLDLFDEDFRKKFGEVKLE